MEITDMEVFLPYYERIRTRTERVIGCIPPGRLEWRPRPDAFSFGDVIRHLGAMERYMFAENVLRRPSRYPGHGPDLARGWEEVREFLRDTHAESVAIFGSLSVEDLRARCTTPGGATLPVWKWLRAMVEHEVHHRGQVYLMLRMLGVDTPPLFGLTSEQVRERSEAPTVSAPDRDGG
ncbi:MAG: DinB family protein [Gemmatimonadota bacterium]